LMMVLCAVNPEVVQLVTPDPGSMRHPVQVLVEPPLLKFAHPDVPSTKATTLAPGASCVHPAAQALLRPPMATTATANFSIDFKYVLPIIAVLLQERLILALLPCTKKRSPQNHDAVTIRNSP
jgi:hypothetical protein